VEQGGRKRRLMSEINVVPYIDVMLVLLIIFMATAPLLTQGVKVDLPKASAEPLAIRNQKDRQPLIVSIDRNARVYLNLGKNPDSALDDASLLARAREALTAGPDRDVLVKADMRVAYGRVMAAMVILQKAGASKVGFLVEPESTAPGRKP
jgi:biopolymer transport protein TolR